MAVTIKLKNASGSDPSASDLVLGELAVRTDNGKIFLKKDNGSVAEVSGGGGVDDGDKGDITVSNSGATWTIDSGATQVANKLPLAGGTLTGALTVSSEISARKLTLSDDGANSPIFMLKTDDSSPWGFTIKNDTYSTSSSVGLKSFQANDGTFYLKLQGDSEYNTFKIQQSSGQAGVSDREILTFNTSGNATFSGSVTATGGFSGSGASITALNASNISSGTIAAARVPTLNQDTSGTAAIATTVTVADESSDTSCNVLFATAATGDLGPKSGTNLTFNSSSGVLTATGFAGALTGDVTGNVSGSSGSTTGNAATATALATARTIAGVSFDGTANISLNNNAITNGAGYITSADGGNAQTLDSLDSSAFLRSNADDTCSHRIVFANCETDNHDDIDTATAYHGAFEVYNLNSGNDAFFAFHTASDFACYFGLDAGINDLAVGGWSFGANSYRIWHEGNDGSSSGLDADKLDGYHAAEAATGSTVVARDGDGDINGRYFEGDWVKCRTTTNSALSSSNIDGGGGFVVAAESGWYYHQSPSAVRSLLNVADGATNVTNNNQLTNGAGYVTSSGAPAATGARVWVNVEGDAGTPYFRDSYGASSLTDISYAVQQINFSTNFSNSNYCFTSGARAGSSGGGGRVVVGYDAPATSYFKYQMRNLGNDNEHVDAACIALFGDM